MKKLLILFLFISSICSLAQQIPEYNHNQKFVSDYANILTPLEEASLQASLNNYESQTGIEIAVVTQNDLQGYEIEDYSNALFNKWGIGKKGVDNGLLILISPSNRKWRIETGYGLEGDLPDMVCNRLSEKYFPSNFRNQQYFNGIDGIIKEFMSILGNNNPAQREAYKLAMETQRKKEKADRAASFETFVTWLGICAILVICIITISMFLNYLRRVREEKVQAEKKRLLEIKIAQQKEEIRVQRRLYNIELYNNTLKKIDSLHKQLEKIYQNSENRTLNNESLYNGAQSYTVSKLNFTPKNTDDEIENYTKLLKNSVLFLENTISSMESNNGVQLGLAKQFQRYNNDYLKLEDILIKHFKDVKNFNSKYPTLYVTKEFNTILYRSNIKFHIDEALNLLAKDDYISSDTFSKLNFISSSITYILDDIKSHILEFENLKLKVTESERILSNITINRLSDLMTDAKNSIDSTSLPVIKNSFTEYKNAYDVLNKNSQNLNVIQLAEYLLYIENGLKNIPQLVNSENKRRIEEVEAVERRRKKKLADEEAAARSRRTSYSSSSYGSYGSSSSYDTSSSSSSSDFGGGDAGGGGDSGGW